MGFPEGASDFLRVKAVLHVAGSEKKFVLQCVHSLRNQGFTESWADGQQRENRIIFIGRNMEKRRENLVGDFKDCIATPLRFEVGAHVQARTELGFGEYRSGIVAAQWEECYAYRVTSFDWEEIFVPFDDDDCIRAAP